MEILRHVNWVDVLVLILLLRISYASFQAGFGQELFSLFGTLLTLILSLHYYSKVAKMIAGSVAGIPVVLADFISFLALFLIFILSVKIIRALLDKVIKVEWHSLIDRAGGLIAGIARACITISLVLIILMLIPLPYMQWSVRDRSLTGKFFLKIGPAVYVKSQRIMPQFLRGEKPVTVEEVMKALSSDKSLGPVKKKAEPGKT